jgi:hypothetical protein
MIVGQHSPRSASPRSASSVIVTSSGRHDAATCRSIHRTSLGMGIGGRFGG